MIFQEHATIKQKLEILSDAAKYDVACTSSGVERKGQKGETGNTAASGICHAFGADGRCISLLKILFTIANIVLTAVQMTSQGRLLPRRRSVP